MDVSKDRALWDFAAGRPKHFEWLVGVISLRRIAVSSRVESQLSKQKSRYAEFGFNKSKNKGNRRVSVGIRGYVDVRGAQESELIGTEGTFYELFFGGGGGYFLVALVVD
jgi:hypothetical protein